MHTTANPIITAVDTPDVEQATTLASDLAPHTAMVKLGLEFFVRHGIAGVQQVTRHGDIPLFLDLKFHDIPNTVAGAVRSAIGTQCNMLTIHTGGGRDMCKAAADALKGEANAPTLLGVTVLTSLNEEMLDTIGFRSTVQDQVLRMVDIAAQAGLAGVVCSPWEIRPIRDRFSDELTLVVPGIRPPGSPQGDQQRTMTPAEAMAEGADYLVIGRPITQAKEPVQAAKSILAAL